MAGVTAALSIGGALASMAGSITKGMAENETAKANAQIYEAQAQNINEAKKITAGQYRTKANVLRGQAVTTAAKGGLKISGSTANSISQSIMELQMDNAYEQYNLDAKRHEAMSNASLQRFKGKQAMSGSLVEAGVTALSAGKDYYDKYWNGSNSTSTWLKDKYDKGTTWLKGQANKIKNRGTKLSGGLPTTNKQIMNYSGGTYIV